MKSTHAHVISCLLAELEISIASGRLARGGEIRVLDVGCGYGGLMADIANVLGADFRIEVFGYEISSHRGADAQYIEKTLAHLRSRARDFAWEDPVHVINPGDPIPFGENTFDFVVSNQVIEHVMDLDHLVKDLGRVLKSGGVGIHHFPAIESLVDPHSGVLWAHRMPNDVWLHRWLRFCGFLRCGKFPAYHKEHDRSLDEFADEFTAYLRRYTHFRKASEVASRFEEGGFECECKYGLHLLKRWLRNVDDQVVVAKAYPLLAERFSNALLKRFASLTLVHS